MIELIQATRARQVEANGKAEVNIRSGCKPGSFLDLLIHATNKETGKPFTDFQVRRNIGLGSELGFGSPGSRDVQGDRQTLH